MPLDGEYLDLPGDLNIAGKLGVSRSNFNISDSREKDLTKFASKRIKPFSERGGNFLLSPATA